MTGLALSVRFKESFKTALAMAVAYGIALSMGWDKPMWAGLAVAVVSLETVGQSLQKAVYRMVGTLLAVVAAFGLLALFPQDRWLFMLFLSAFVGLCTYLMAGPRRQYIWNVAGFVCLIIVASAGPEATRAFDIAILRAQETGLGILVYGVVTVLLWPRSSHGALMEAVRGLTTNQRRVFQSQLAIMKGAGDLSGLPASSVALTQAQNRCGQLLGAAEVDSYRVWEAGEAWRRGVHLHAMIRETLESWQQSSDELRDLDGERLLPNLDAFAAEIDGRLAEIESMYEGIEPARLPESIELAVDEDAVRQLPHFQRAALVSGLDRLHQLEQLTRSLFDTVGAITGFASLASIAHAPVGKSWGALLDLERIGGVLRVVTSIWLAYLAVIFVPALPGGFILVILAGSLAMAVAQLPQLPISAAFLPAAMSTLAASLIYVLIMPKLSSFVGLGLLIFIVTFSICYLFASPRQIIGRSAGLIVFMLIAGISNQQSYSFLAVVNVAMWFPIVFTILAITANVPVSTKPDVVVPRLLARFFRSCEYLIATMPLEAQRAPTSMERLRRAFHLHEVATLPGKLGAWSGFLSRDAVPAEARPHVQQLVSQLRALARTIEHLREARSSPQAEVLVRQLLQDVRAWHVAIQASFARLGEDPGAVPLAFRTDLGPNLAHLEARVEAALNEAPEETLTPREEVSFYRLLGAYRGVSDALGEVLRLVALVDWGRMREARF